MRGGEGSGLKNRGWRRGENRRKKVDNLCGYRVYGDRTKRHRQVESLEKVVKAGVRMGAGVGVEGRVEVKRRRKSMEGWKKSGRHVCWKNAEK